MERVFVLTPSGFGNLFSFSYVCDFWVLAACTSVDHVRFVFNLVFHSEKALHFLGLPDDCKGKINSCKFLRFLNEMFGNFFVFLTERDFYWHKCFLIFFFSCYYWSALFLSEIFCYICYKSLWISSFFIFEKITSFSFANSELIFLAR